jgi:transcription antitermination factor NusA-like protein
VDKGKFYVADPSGYRTGNGPGHRAADTLNKVADDAVAACSKNQVQRKVALSEELLQEKFDLIRGAVMMGKFVIRSSCSCICIVV